MNRHLNLTKIRKMIMRTRMRKTTGMKMRMEMEKTMTTAQALLQANDAHWEKEGGLRGSVES